MRKAMEYHIISGRVIETRRSFMPCRSEGKKSRGVRVAGNSSLRKIALNEREGVKRAARTLNANFGDGFLFVTLKYSNSRLPARYEDAGKDLDKFLRGARKGHGKGKLRYFAVTANWSPKHQRAERLHHHVVLDSGSIDLLASLWPEGEFYVQRVDAPGDLTKLAAYLLDNVHELEKGKKKYRTAKGMEKPIYTEPVEVSDVEGIVALPDTAVVDGEPSYNEDGRVVGSYIRAVARTAPKVRGSMVLLPKRARKRRSEEGYFAVIREQDA